MRFLFLSVIIGTALAAACADTHTTSLVDSSTASCLDGTFEDDDGGSCAGAADGGSTLDPQPGNETDCEDVSNDTPGTWTAGTDGADLATYRSDCCTACTAILGSGMAADATLTCPDGVESNIVVGAADIKCATEYFWTDGGAGALDVCTGCGAVANAAPNALSYTTCTDGTNTRLNIGGTCAGSGADADTDEAACTILTAGDASVTWTAGTAKCAEAHFHTEGADASSDDECTACDEPDNASGDADLSCTSADDSRLTNDDGDAVCDEGFYHTAGADSSAADTCTRPRVCGSCTVADGLDGDDNAGDCPGHVNDQEACDADVDADDEARTADLCDWESAGQCQVLETHLTCASTAGDADVTILCEANYDTTIEDAGEDACTNDPDNDCTWSNQAYVAACWAITDGQDCQDEVDGSTFKCHWADTDASEQATPTADVTCTGDPSPAADSDEGGLSGGAIAGIIIGCVVAIAVIGVVIWWCSRGSGDAN